MTLVDVLLALLLRVPAPVEPAPGSVKPAELVVQEVAEVPVLPEHPASLPEPAPVLAPRAPAPVEPATQLPEEVIGRAIDGPNGERCVVVDAELTTECEPAA